MRVDGLVVDGIKVTDIYQDDPDDVSRRHVFQCPVCGDGTAYDTIQNDPAMFEALTYDDCPSSMHRRCVVPKV